MAIVDHVPFPLPTWTDFDGVRVRQWRNLHNGDEGQPITLARFNDKTVQISGTFGVGGTVEMEGSLDGAIWTRLKDVFNVSLSATSEKLFTITEVPVYMRPVVTAGDANTDILVSILVR